MTETEYIIATNLAKIRSARRTFREVLPNHGVSRDDYDAVLQMLYAAENGHYDQIDALMEAE